VLVNRSVQFFRAAERMVPGPGRRGRTTESMTMSAVVTLLRYFHPDVARHVVVRRPRIPSSKQQPEHAVESARGSVAGDGHRASSIASAGALQRVSRPEDASRRRYSFILNIALLKRSDDVDAIRSLRRGGQGLILCK
jgi:hypothetical protein